MRELREDYEAEEASAGQVTPQTHLQIYKYMYMHDSTLYFCCYSFIIRPKIEIDKLKNQVFNKNASNQRGKKYCLITLIFKFNIN